MGLFSFLKSFFKKKEEIREGDREGKTKPEEQKTKKTQILTLNELEQWLITKERENLAKAQESWQFYKSELQNIIEHLQATLNTLKIAEPRLPELYKQNKALADGNRAAYISSCNLFLKSINLDFPLENLPLFVAQLEQQLNSFMAENEKVFFVTKEFFTDQTLELKADLQKLYEILSNLKNLVKSTNLSELAHIKKQLTELKAMLEQKELLLSELAQLEDKIKTVESESNTIAAKIIELNKSPKIQNIKELEAKLSELAQKIKAKELELYNVFADLDTPLRKLAWQRPEHKKLIENFVNSPISSVLHDSDFKFESVLVALRLALESNEIDLNEKKRAKLLNVLNSFLNENYLQNWSAEYSLLKQEQSNLQSKLETSDIILELHNLESKNAELRELKQTLLKKKEKLQRKVQKYDLQKDLESLNSYLEQFGVSLTVN